MAEITSTPGKRFSKKRVALLNALSHMDSRQRRAVLRTADKDLIKCICEYALKVLQGAVMLKNTEKARLKKHRTILRKLTGNRGNIAWRSKKHTLLQNGGSFLPILLAPLISTIFSKILGN